MQTSLGSELIAELGRRRQRGMYFDYNSYQVLRDVSTVAQMQAFLNERGFESVLARNDSRWLADGLAEAVEDRTPPWWTTIDISGVVLIPIWLLTRMENKFRVFPRKGIEPISQSEPP